MICKEYKCVFVHIPKTAGQSVEHLFLRLLGLTWHERAPLLLRYNRDPRLGPERLAHLTAEEYVRCGYMNEAEFSSYYKFSFVRNPWARLVSEYHYRKYAGNMDFKSFLMRGLPQPGPSDAYRHIVPQCDFLYDISGRLLVDFVGRFESLQADFDIVCQRLRIADTRLPHINASAAVHAGTVGSSSLPTSYTKYYDEETKALVAEMYRKDIDTFSYEFGQ